MENQLSPSEKKLIAILKYAPMGIAEIYPDGTIVQLNLMGEAFFEPIMKTYNLDDKNIFPLLAHMSAEVVDKIKNFSGDAGVILMNEVYSCKIGGGPEKHFNFISTKIFPDCIIVSFDDITEKYLKELAMRESEIQHAVAQGKFEIASGVLHDIGNAVVGFGSYLTRIKRTLEQNNITNIENLAVFFAAQKASIGVAIGEDKAAAVVDMLNGITQSQNNSNKEISKSIKEQLNIISHVQEILHIQRQYISGYETQERKPVNLKTIINDCIAMILASIDKRNITVSLDVSPELPVIKGDRTKLMQVILNILKNSMEAIDIDSPEKNISVRLYAESGQLLLEIKDTGTGFDEITAIRLFERGFTTKSSGSGLGLYNCKAIIESHAGTIDIVSDGPEKGAAVTIKFKT